MGLKFPKIYFLAGQHVCLSRSTRFQALILAAMATCASTPVQADDACDLNRVRTSIKQLAPASDPSAQWIEAKAINMVLGAVQTVRADETVAAIQFGTHRESSAMEAPHDFTFRSGWLLNTQFAFRQGQLFRIKARYDVAPGTSLYALAPPGESYLTIFARPDGTLCNKVMNTNAGDHGFLVREYVSEPRTSLRLVRDKANGTPLTLRIVYLGTSGGVASFRELWSRESRIVDSRDHAFDPGTSEIRIGPVTLENVVITSNALTATIAAPPARIPMNRYWTDRFGE